MNRGYRFVLVKLDKFSEFGGTVLLKKKNVRTIKDSFENVLIGSKQSPQFN